MQHQMEDRQRPTAFDKTSALVHTAKARSIFATGQQEYLPALCLLRYLEP